MKLSVYRIAIQLPRLAFLIGLMGFLSIGVCHVLSYAGVRMVSSKIRFPLGQTGGFTVSKQGEIIHYSEYNRLEIFDKDGRFLKGWFVYSPFAHSEIQVDPNNHIHLVFSGDKHLVFDMKANTLQESVEEGIYHRSFKLNYTEHQDDEGNTYKLCHKFPRIGVIKVTTGGEEFIDITEPFYLWPFRGIGTAMVFIFSSLAVGGIIEGLRKRKRKRQNPEAAEPAV